MPGSLPGARGLGPGCPTLLFEDTFPGLEIINAHEGINLHWLLHCLLATQCQAALVS